MKIQRKLSIGVIAIAAILLIAAIGGYAYWSVQQQVTNNQMASGHMAISVLNGDGTAVSALNVAAMMPGTEGSKQYSMISSPGNPDTDVWFKVTNVTDVTSLADNVKVAFLLQSDLSSAWWLEPSGPVTYGSFSDPNNNPATNPAAITPHLFKLSDYNEKVWESMTGYVDLPAGTERRITVFYTLPLDCADDCHDDTANFDMTFGLSQHH